MEINLTNLKIIEVGTGSGGILYYFREMGNEVCGCDLDSEYIAFGRDKYNLNLQVGTVDDIDIPWTPKPALGYIKKYYGGDILGWIQNAHVYYFTLKTLRNLMRKADYEFVCGNEIANIHSIFKKSSTQVENDYESDYVNAVVFLRRMEIYRFMPTPYNLKRLAMPVIISSLKRVGLYNTAKRMYHKFED